MFQKDGFDYFTEMMPALHNYVTVDTPAFLSNENHVLAMFNMCKAVSVVPPKFCFELLSWFIFIALWFLWLDLSALFL